jgi:flagellar hook-length control protein FliK
VGSEQWADELGTRLTWMVDRGQQSASLRLSPDNLGPLEVRISITDDKASVWFGAAHADTRAAIEQALPRLREMLGAQGLSLTDSGVFREPPRHQPPPPGSFGSNQSSQQEGEVMISTRRIGLLDAYA